MKKLLVIILLSSVLPGFGQAKENVPTAPETEINASAEAEEALKSFDFGKIAVNPNNLGEKEIKDLRANFFYES